MAETPETKLRVLSLNCWGLKVVSKNRAERIFGIASELAKSNHDIIALQEIWVFADYEHVRESVSKRLPHSKYFYSGALGAGLALFSRFPIIATSVHPYSLNGAPIDVSAGDWFVGKAAASITILHPVLDQVQIFNTHLFAKGGEDGPEHNRAHRLVNAWELAKLARQAAELGRYVIAAGDFNSIPTTLPMTIIRDHAALSDSWSIVHPDANEQSSLNTIPTPQEAIVRFGVTADSPLNSYSAGKPLDQHARKSRGKRLDYIFYRQPSRLHHPAAQSYPTLKSRECKVVFTDRVPGYNFSFSDHFGLEATLEIQSNDEENHLIQDDTTMHNIESQQGNPLRQSALELSSDTVATIIRALAACCRYSRHRARRELTVFVLCIVVLLGLTISSSWLPQSWINPVFILFTVFITWLGTTMLYEGFLYGQWECNALMNVIEELEIYRNGVEIQSSGHRSSGSL